MEQKEEIRLCACGCGKKIIIRKHHKSYGIPKYLRGHYRKIRIEKEKLIFLYKEYNTLEGVAKQLGYSKPTIFKLFKEYKIKLPKKTIFKKGMIPHNKLNLNERRIIELYLSSKSTPKVAKIFNCDSGTISSILKKHNIRKFGRRLELDNKKIIELYINKEISPIKIAKIFNCSCGVIYRILRENNIKLFDKGKFKKGGISPNKKNLPSEEVVKLYVNEKWSLRKIANKFNCSVIVIQRILKENNIKAHPRKNKSFKEQYGEEKAKEIKNEIKKNRALQIFPIKDTKIEVKIQNFLKQLNIDFFTHQYIKEIEHGYQCDILIPSMNLVIECDGDYWHKYPIGKEIDHIRTKELIEKGFKILRLWEHEINKMDINEFKDKIEYMIKQ